MHQLFSVPAVKYDFYWQPTFQVRTTCLIKWLQPDYPYKGKKKLPEKKPYSGEMTPGSKQRLQRAMENLIQRTKPTWIFNPCIQKSHTFSLAFLTLTIPPDKLILADQGYPILKRFLRNAERTTRRRTGLKSYLWKAELQTDTGQLHYHLATNNFLRMDYCKDMWNHELKKEGLLDGHAKRFGNFCPPSTYIKGPDEHTYLMHYLSKYISKDTQNTRTLKGKVWDCSEDLKQKLYSAELDTETDFKIQNALLKGTGTIKVLDNCTIINHPNPLKLLSDKCLSEYKNWQFPKHPTLPFHNIPKTLPIITAPSINSPEEELQIEQALNQIEIPF